jgi:hypothetical protein
MNANTTVRMVLLVAVGTTLLFAGTGVSAACDTCVAPDDEDRDSDPLWSNEDVPYDVDENTSLVMLFWEEIQAEMAADFGGENESNASNERLVETSAANVSVDVTVDVDA